MDQVLSNAQGCLNGQHGHVRQKACFCMNLK